MKVVNSHHLSEKTRQTGPSVTGSESPAAWLNGQDVGLWQADFPDLRLMGYGQNSDRSKRLQVRI